MRAVEDGGCVDGGWKGNNRSIDPSIRISQGGEGIDRSRGKHSPSPWHNAHVMRVMVMLLPVIIVPVFTPAAGRRRRRILPPPPPCAIVFAPVFLPTAGQRNTSRVDVDVASYRRHRHARSSLSLSSSPPPVNVAHRCQHRILWPPPTRAIFVVVVVPVPVPVPVPAACRRRASTMHPPAATAPHDLRRCRRPHPSERAARARGNQGQAVQYLPTKNGLKQDSVSYPIPDYS